MWIFKIFKIFSIFGFFTGPILFALFGSFGTVGLSSVIKWLFTGSQLTDATKAGIFVTTMGGATGVSATNKLFSKLRKFRRVVAAFGDDVDSPKPPGSK